LPTDHDNRSFPLWPSAPPPGYLGQLADSCQLDYASRRSNLTQKDCDFYHTSVLTDGSLVQGAWDHRGTEQSYLGDQSFVGRRVLEFGPATGHFTYFLERQGAEVVSFEVGYDTSIDLLQPITQEDVEPLRGILMACAGNQLLVVLAPGLWLSYKDCVRQHLRLATGSGGI
jgi:hypothetical protein